MAVSSKRALADLRLAESCRKQCDIEIRARVKVARQIGLSWEAIAEALEINVETARRRYLKASG